MANAANYGVLKDPDLPASTFERKSELFPSTRQVLTNKTGKDLAKYMQGCIGALEFPSILSLKMPILWLINSQNEFVFALEEYINAETEQPASIRPKDFPKEIINDKVSLIRLGHPSLTDDLKAKIGGEIYLEENKWYISNDSGRYGYGEERKKVHLQSVAKMLKKHGIKLKLDYIPNK